ncbi:MAG TPA: tyrosine-type recombinase/integrase, partial [Streptosporangiaceae bacterium]|nr:tyrosine-type recombinase/integrase [Streptosporangiaceae bacterium]
WTRTTACHGGPEFWLFAPAGRRLARRSGSPGGSAGEGRHDGGASGPARRLGLTWDRINLDVGELRIEEQLQRVRHQLVRRQTKTESSDAPLPLPGLCVTALKLRREDQDADRAHAGDSWIETGLVFTTRLGTSIEPRNFNRSFDRRILRAGISKITVHGTRKTCGSLLAALDIHPRVAMQILRHSKIAVTMEIYTEVPSEATRDALKKLGQWLDT